MTSNAFAALAILLGLGAAFAGLVVVTRSSGRRPPVLQGIVAGALLLLGLAVAIALGTQSRKKSTEVMAENPELAAELGSIRASLGELRATSDRHEAHLVALLQRPLAPTQPASAVATSTRLFGWPTLFAIFVGSIAAWFALDRIRAADRRIGPPDFDGDKSRAAAQRLSVWTAAISGVPLAVLAVANAGVQLWNALPWRTSAPVADDRIFVAFGDAATTSSGPVLATFLVPFAEEGGCGPSWTLGTRPSPAQDEYLQKLAFALAACGGSEDEKVEIEVRGFSSSSPVKESWQRCKGATSPRDANVPIANERADRVAGILRRPCARDPEHCVLRVEAPHWKSLEEMEQARRFNDTRRRNGSIEYVVARGQLNRRVEVHLIRARECELEIGRDDADVAVAPAQFSSPRAP